MILSIFGFLLSILISSFIFAQAVLPLIYSLPLSVYYYFKGRVTVGAILIQFVSPLIWIVVLTIIGILLRIVSPSILDFLLSDPGFLLGQPVGILIMLINFLRPSGRADMKADYLNGTYSRFATRVHSTKSP